MEGPSANASGTSRVCRIRVVEPALPRSAVSATSKTYEPDFGGWLGAKRSSVEPSRSPDTTAPLIAAARNPTEGQKHFDRMMYYVSQAKLPKRRRKRPSYPREIWGKGAKFPNRKE